MLPLMNNVLLINEAACVHVCARVCVCGKPHLKEDLPLQLFQFVCGACCVFLSPCCSDKNAACVLRCAAASVTSGCRVRSAPSTELP